MSSTPSDTTSQRLGALSNQQLIDLFSLTTDRLLTASRQFDRLTKLLQEVIIEQDRQNNNLTGLSRDEWRESRWGDRVEEVFLQQKKLLDRISFWHLKIPDKNIAMEYFYQLCNKEITFADIKKENPNAQYFPERKLKTVSESLRKILQKMNLNVPFKPINNGEGEFILLQVTHRSSAELDQKRRLSLLQDLESQWCNREINRLLDDWQENTNLLNISKVNNQSTTSEP